jgi:hypothetical protein
MSFPLAVVSGTLLEHIPVLAVPGRFAEAKMSTPALLNVLWWECREKIALSAFMKSWGRAGSQW